MFSALIVLPRNRRRLLHPDLVVSYSAMIVACTRCSFTSEVSSRSHVLIDAGNITLDDLEDIASTRMPSMFVSTSREVQ